VSAPYGTSRCGHSMGRAIPLSHCNGPWRWSRRYGSVGATSGSRSIPRQATMRGRRHTPTPSCTPGSSRTPGCREPEANQRTPAEGAGSRAQFIAMAKVRSCGTPGAPLLQHPGRRLRDSRDVVARTTVK